MIYGYARASAKSQVLANQTAQLKAPDAGASSARRLAARPLIGRITAIARDLQKAGAHLVAKQSVAA